MDMDKGRLSLQCYVGSRSDGPKTPGIQQGTPSSYENGENALRTYLIPQKFRDKIKKGSGGIILHQEAKALLASPLFSSIFDLGVANRS